MTSLLPNIQKKTFINPPHSFILNREKNIQEVLCCWWYRFIL